MRTPTAPVDERALLARLRGGDREAFSLLVDRHGGALLRLAEGIVRNGATAEEVVQEAWMSALEALDTFEGRSSLRTWLFHIVANKARTRVVKEGRSVPFSGLGAETEGDDPAVDPSRFAKDGMWRDPPGLWSEENPERLAQSAQALRAIQQAIAALPEAQRTVITLRDIDGVEAEEICNLLGLTLSNQRVLLHRARAKVRTALESLLSGAR
jgi:RNA polymerase sigma-70 factor (ECF subfamily)